MTASFYEMIIFNSDLDNTIIYSYKHDIGNQKKCVELYQEREISFITERTFELLKLVKKNIEMVPTTTRTMEQYNRINLGIGDFKYALVCNGGVLLVNGKSDEDWYQESLRLVGESRITLIESMELLKKDKNIFFEIRFIDDLFVYTKSREPEKTVAYLTETLHSQLVDIFNNGMKVYVVPKNLSKGSAVQRLKEKLKASTVIAAGDSTFDISMLEEADYAIAPEQLKINKNENVYTFSEKDLFSEKVLETVLHMEELLNQESNS